MTTPTRPAAAIARAFIGRLGVDIDQHPADTYLARHLAGHVGAPELWSELANRLEVLAQLDPTSVGTEAFRTLFGRGDMPDAITVWMVNADELAVAPAEQRGLVWALGAQLLGLNKPGLSEHPDLLWCRLARVSPHISLAGHTAAVTAVAFGQLPDGRTLLATGSEDHIVRVTALEAEMSDHLGLPDRFLVCRRVGRPASPARLISSCTVLWPTVTPLPWTSSACTRSRP
jgi:hypothetical protein